MMWVRWTLPRLRIDQVMTTCLKYCVPLASICFVGAMLWKLNDWPSVNNVARLHGQTLADVREDWVLPQPAGRSAEGSEEQPAPATSAGVLNSEFRIQNSESHSPLTYAAGTTHQENHR
jgi:hypothetical protein